MTPAGPAGIALANDLHTHTTFSDGSGTLVATVDAATAAGLAEVGVSDHVRASTDWLPGYVAAVRDAAERAPLPLRCGVEAKILDTAGRLDLPADLTGVQYVLLADHQVPTPAGPASPAEVRDALAAGRLDAAGVVEMLVTASAAALRTAPLPAGLAHLFSVLPKVGLSEVDVPDDAVRLLAAACRSAGGWVELNEKWRCPSARVAGLLLAEGVPLTGGSDAHAPERVGRWAYARDIADLLVPTAG